MKENVDSRVSLRALTSRGLTCLLENLQSGGPLGRHFPYDLFWHLILRHLLGWVRYIGQEVYVVPPVHHFESSRFRFTAITKGSCCCVYLRTDSISALRHAQHILRKWRFAGTSFTLTDNKFPPAVALESYRRPVRGLSTEHCLQSQSFTTSCCDQNKAKANWWHYHTVLDLP